jgi:hypothetical protein
MSEQDRAAERAEAVADTMHDIAEVDAHALENGGIDRVGLARIKERLLELAERHDVFGDDDFPPPEAGKLGALTSVRADRPRRAGR